MECAVTVGSRGVRNAFRSRMRSIAVVTILGLVIGLSFVMLIAYHSVSSRISASLASVGTTVNVEPAGFSTNSSVHTTLTTQQLRNVAHLAHVTGVDELAWTQVQPTGTTDQPAAPSGATTHATLRPGAHRHHASTSLRSPTKVKITCSNNTCSGDGLTSVGGGQPRLPSNFSLSIYVVGTNHPANPTNINASTLTLVAGHLISGTSDSNQAIVSTQMAAKNHLKVGSTFTAFGKTLTVAGIFKTDTDIGNDTIVVPLATEQRLGRQPNEVLGAVVTADSLTNLAAVTREIRATLGTSADVTSNVAQANQAMGQLNDAKRTSLESLIASVAAGAIIVFLIMIVRERKHEVGILKAVGGSNSRIMGQYIAEALTLAVVGATLGLIGGGLAASRATGTILGHSGNPASTDGPYGSNSAALATSSSVHAVATASIVLLGLVTAISIALLGSAAASMLISRIHPAEVLRSD